MPSFTFSQSARNENGVDAKLGRGQVPPKGFKMIPGKEFDEDLRNARFKNSDLIAKITFPFFYIIRINTEFFIERRNNEFIDGFLLRNPGSIV